MTTPAPHLPVVAILGPITIRDGDAEVTVPAKLDRSVLAHLILAEGRSLSVDMLIEAVWGEHSPPRARNSLQVKISRLRGRLGEFAPQLEFTQGSYRLRLTKDQTDIGIFSGRVASGRAKLDTGDTCGASEDLSTALELWRGEPLADLDEHPRLVAARSRLSEEWMTAHELLAQVCQGPVGTAQGRS